jgi:predicted kinase
VVESLSDLQLSLGQSVIVDAVNAEEEAKSMWRGLASKHGATMRIVECRCSDEALHRQRLQSRYRPWSRIPEPTWGQVQERRRSWTEWKEPAFLVDSTNSLEDSLEEVLRWLGT